jgi:hypothetical protein
MAAPAAPAALASTQRFDKQLSVPLQVLFG